MRHLITVVEDLRGRGIGFRSLNEGAIDMTSASGELIFNIFSALAQFERRLIQERTKAGLAAARARGRNGGRPRVLSEEMRVLTVKKLYGDKSIPVSEICKTLHISRSTYYRYVARKSKDTPGGVRLPDTPPNCNQTMRTASAFSLTSSRR
jgi:DNA invertase Pin-like site-specific DNA recombinase